MTISREFYIDGFYREDKGEDGAVFLRYEAEEEDKRKAEIQRTPMYYGGRDTENYTLSVPKPRARKIEACAIVVRTSKNNYTVTLYKRNGIIFFKSSSLDDVGKQCREYFKN